MALWSHAAGLVSVDFVWPCLLPISVELRHLRQNLLYPNWPSHCVTAVGVLNAGAVMTILRNGGGPWSFKLFRLVRPPRTLYWISRISICISVRARCHLQSRIHTKHHFRNTMKSHNTSRGAAHSQRGVLYLLHPFLNNAGPFSPRLRVASRAHLFIRNTHFTLDLGNTIDCRCGVHLDSAYSSASLMHCECGFKNTVSDSSVSLQ